MSDSDELAAFAAAQEARIGTVERHCLGTVDARTIRRYALAIGDENPIHHDEAEAHAAGYSGIVAPPNLLSAIVEWGAGKPQTQLGPDGTSRRGGSTLRLMGAGEEIEVMRPVVAGTEIWSEEEIVIVEHKQGRSGPLVFVTARHDFTDASGAPYNRNRRTIMVRP